MINEIPNRAVAESQVETKVGEPEPFLTKKEVAERLLKTPRTIENWQRQGFIPVIRIGRSVYYRWSDIYAHMQKFRVCGDTEKAEG